MVPVATDLADSSWGAVFDDADWFNDGENEVVLLESTTGQSWLEVNNVADNQLGASWQAALVQEVSEPAMLGLFASSLFGLGVCRKTLAS